MRLLVFQHIPVEHPGSFRDFLAADGVAWDAVELDAGEPIPSLACYDALLVMGGPMDTWHEDRYPWLAAEKRAIAEAVLGLGMPTLGVCLGAQLLAEALGGEVAPMAAPEVGVLDVEVTAEGRRDPLLRGLGPALKCLQWHSSEVVRLPPGARVLARSPACAVQAFAATRSAYGIQFHVEQTLGTVPEWGCVPVYRSALDGIMGAGALARLEDEVSRHMPAFEDAARHLYDNFFQLAREPAARVS